MEDNLFDINNFNIIQDEENYYFFRALNMADNDDIEQGITVSEEGKIVRIRTDRERYEGKTKYTEDSQISLEELYDHIKMHYRKDTNCISLTSNSNVAVNYGRESYKDRYVMIKIPKKEFGEKVVFAGQYMLKELYLRIQQEVERLPEKEKRQILDVFEDIEEATERKTLQDIIAKRYNAKTGEVIPSKAHLRKGIVYSSPHSRISSYQALDEEQLLEVNKVYAKLAILENKNILKHVIPHSSNSKLRETIGNAFSSTEVIHYGGIKLENVVEIPKEVVDIFALIQQVDGIDISRVEKLKRAIIIAVQNGKPISSIPEITSQIKKNISIDEMYELTEGKVSYGKANSILKNMFYLSKSRQNAIALSNVLAEILGNNSGFEDILQHIREHGFRVEPEIISRQSGKGIKLSESVNLNLQNEEQLLVDEIKKLTPDELSIVIKNGGLYNARDIITTIYSDTKENKSIDKARYYAEAIIAMYDWQNIGIEEFKISERNELITRIQQRNCMDIYNKLNEMGVEESQIPTLLLNVIMREGFYEQYKNGNLEELLNNRQDILQNNINIEVVEKFLGYYDIENTGIRLKDYQQRAYDNINKIFEDKKFAQVIFPTGAGKSFVALAQMQKYAVEHPNEKMLYLAPQDEILNQIKNYIIKYVHGKKDTIGKTEDEIIAEVFPNITFETYSGLLAKRGQEVIKDQYGMIVLDELHRTGAKEWEEKVDTLLANQTDDVKVLGTTATRRRDVDGRDMVNETAKKLGYTDEEIKQRKHIAANMTLENAIRMGYVVNPKLVYCKYDLILSGKMDELRAKIDDIQDEEKRAEELQKYNELKARLNKEIDDEIGEEARKKLEKDARKNLDSGIGKEEILKQNVKKGGKYIVFIPVSDQGDIEDEDGNRIGIKTGEDKIKAYQEYLNKVFEGTEIVPDLYSMLGSYSKEKNKEELDAFEADNTDKTKFMVVMNKANEGLHIEGVDGIVWFRALDENSRILYLQQLGRVIYALDEDNPLPDDKRPIVIDLANNSLTVKIEKDFENSHPIDDLEALTIVTEWINMHDGMLPDRSSSNKQEQHYYAILRRIQNKYSKYLDGFDDFEDLTEEEKSWIEEIIDLAISIDLWNIDLPPIPKTRGIKEEFNPFTMEGVLKDFVEIEDEITGMENERAISKFVKVCEALSQQDFRFDEFKYTRIVKEKGKRRVIPKTLADIQKEYPNIDIDKVIKETGVSIDYSIGRAKTMAVAAAKGTGTYLITEEEKKKLIELGVIVLEKESAIATFVKVCEALSQQGFKFNEFKYEKRGKPKTLADIQKEYPNIDIDKVIEETGVSIDYSIGNAKTYASNVVKGRKTTPITEKDKQKLIELGVIVLEKESAMETFVKVCEALSQQDFRFDKFKYNRIVKEKGKRRAIPKTLADIQKEYPNIDIDKVIKETGVSIDYSIGSAKAMAEAAVKGRGTSPITEKDKQKLIELGVIVLEKESAIATFVKVCEALSQQDFRFDNFKYNKMVKEKGKRRAIPKTLADIQKEYPNIDIDKVIKETGVSIDYSIGSAKTKAGEAVKGRGSYLITEKDKQKLIELGVIVLEKESAIATFVKVCEALSQQGFKFNEFKYEKRRKPKTLADIQKEYPNIDIDKVIKTTGVSIDYSIGSVKTTAVAAVKGRGSSLITEKDKQKLIELGVIVLEKESAIATFVKVCEALSQQDFKFDKFQYTKTVIEEGKRRAIQKTLADIQKEYLNIDIDKVIKTTGVSIDYSIGSARATAVAAVKGRGTCLITEEEKKKLIELGVIVLEKESAIATFIKVCEALSQQDFRFDKFQYKRTVIEEGKRRAIQKTLADIQKEYPNIDIDKVIEETGVSIDYSIGNAKAYASTAVKGRGRCLITESEKKELINMGIINLSHNLQQARQNRDDAKTVNAQTRELEQQVAKALEKRGKNYE